jgi:hypothetical protein
VQYRVSLSPGEAKEYVFLAACAESEAPTNPTLIWTRDTLRRAARDGWRDWPASKP